MDTFSFDTATWLSLVVLVGLFLWTGWAVFLRGRPLERAPFLLYRVFGRLGFHLESMTEFQNGRLMADAVGAGVDILTIGQYLRPTPKHARIQKYYTPAEFEDLAGAGRDMGIRWVFSGPLVRSSYHAEDVFDDMMATIG